MGWMPRISGWAERLPALTVFIVALIMLITCCCLDHCCLTYCHKTGICPSVCLSVHIVCIPYPWSITEKTYVAFWVFVCVKLLLADEYIVNGEIWVQAYSGCIVAGHPKWHGCSLNGRGAMMHEETQIKAGARWLTVVALLSAAR